MQGRCSVSRTITLFEETRLPCSVDENMRLACSWLPIAGPADPILRVVTAFKEFILATSIDSCCFLFGLLTYAGAVVLHISPSSSRLPCRL